MTNEWNKLRKVYVSLYRKLELASSLDYHNKNEEYMDKFLREMAYDFNSANALTAIYEHVKLINKSIRDKNTTVDTLVQLFNALHDMFEIFGLGVDIKPLTIDELHLVNSWQEARNNKDFEQADILRQKIVDAGIEL